jgi:FAD/FMN-containing dehydrogenase
VFRVPPGGSRATLAAPPAFPPSLLLYQQAYQNWSGETLIQNVWTAAPRSPEEVVTLVNWAAAAGWRVRPKGRSHGWSPLVLPQGFSGERYLLLDTTQHLTGVRLDPRGLPPTVTAQAGVTLDLLLDQLGAAGLGFSAVPAVGSLTLGGALAIDAHGSAIQGLEETPLPGKTYGSLSNAVLALTAVAWDSAQRQYALRTFHRDDPAIGPLLVHLGRAFITSATLQVGPDVNLRCVSHGDLPASRVFAPPDTADEVSFEACVRRSGRAEAIWFPFTPCPWLKVWSVAPERPDSSLELHEPYPFTFANWVTPAQSAFIEEGLANDDGNTPAFQLLEMAAVEAGLLVTGTLDTWGPSRFSSLYVKASTLRVAESGYAVLTRTDRIQRVVSEFYTAFKGLVEHYAQLGLYPVNGPMDIRVTGLDRAGDVLMLGAVEPRLSALRPRPDHPDWDCAVWLDVVTIPGTLGAQSFFSELETWILGHYTGEYAAVRVEWSKGWGYSPLGAWSRASFLAQDLPASHTQGQKPGEGWAATLAMLDGLDPHRVFTNPFLETLMG